MNTLQIKMSNKKKREMKDDKFWHVRTVDEVCNETSCDLKKGLDESEVIKRHKIFGYNKIAEERKFHPFKTLLRNANTLLIYILLSAAIISFLSGEMIEFAVVMIIIFLTVFLSFIQEYKADQSIKALSKLTAKKVEVLRDGKRKQILSEHLVPGDIVYIKRGAIIPADIRIIESFGLSVNEAILTGESASKSKIPDSLMHQDLSLGDRINMAFAGTFANAGSGVGIVVETGLNSEIGKISSSLQSIEVGKSPIQKKVDRMSKKISYVVLVACFALFIFMKFQGYDTYAALVLIGAAAVAGIPESLPLALTFTLSNGIKKMAKENAIVKDLSSVETLGTTTAICTDKTGTLTENKMRVSKIYFSSGKEVSVVGKGYEPMNFFFVDGNKIEKNSLEVHKDFFKACVLCNDTEVSFSQNEWGIFGEPTEGALITLAKSVDFDDVVLKENHKRVHEIPFNSSRKFMITVNEEGKGSYYAYLKGAAERVLEKCSKIRNEKGEVVDLSKSSKNKILHEMEHYSSEGLRVLFIASKNLGHTHNEKSLENDFVFEGFVGIEDPIREDVYKAVSDCQNAGIRIIMITGDYKTTATHIGKQLGIVNSKYKFVLEGKEIDNLTDIELDEAIDSVAIFSRATPEHKLRIVNSLQRKGEIVAMTGDGVNDAPALKKADIGISMGKGGTEVAREASNMILTDDNFSTIAKAVKQGRTIYSNIRRFIYYLLAGNLTALSILVLAIMFGFASPFTALMVLFINIITSTIPAMALSVEPSNEKVMRQRPRNPKENLLSGYIISKIIVLVPFMIIGTLGLYLWEILVQEVSVERAMTIAFATLIMFILFHTFNARRLHTTIFNKKFFSNKFVFLSVGMSFSMMLAAIYTSVGQMIFNTVPLYMVDWIAILIVSSSVVIFSEMIKFSVQAEFKEQASLQGSGSCRLE